MELLQRPMDTVSKIAYINHVAPDINVSITTTKPNTYVVAIADRMGTMVIFQFGTNFSENETLGQIKMYLNTKLPLKCTAINSCLFVDYPNCAYSQLYGHNVCCSTKQCL